MGLPVRAAAAWLLRMLLPVCVLAATVVAVMGLLRVGGQPAATPVSQDSPSLRLGAAGGGTDDAPNVVPPAAVPTRTPSPAPATPQAPAPEPVTKSVVVINASAISGLAGRTANALRLRGVSVAAVGNLSAARRPVTRTVFYPPGGLAQAQTLATLTDAPSVAPAPGWLPPDGKLVLVVTDSSSS